MVPGIWRLEIGLVNSLYYFDSYLRRLMVVNNSCDLLVGRWYAEAIVSSDLEHQPSHATPEYLGRRQWIYSQLLRVAIIGRAHRSLSQ